MKGEYKYTMVLCILALITGAVCGSQMAVHTAKQEPKPKRDKYLYGEVLRVTGPGPDFVWYYTIELTDGSERALICQEITYIQRIYVGDILKINRARRTSQDHYIEFKLWKVGG